MRYLSVNFLECCGNNLVIHTNHLSEWILNMQHASDTLPFKKKVIITLLTHEYFPKEHKIYRYSNIPVSMEFSRQEYWSGLHSLLQGIFPNLGIEPRSPALQADSLPFELPRKPQDTSRSAKINISRTPLCARHKSRIWR